MLPLPSRSHPQKQNRAVYTKELTHLAFFKFEFWVACAGKIADCLEPSPRPYSEHTTPALSAQVFSSEGLPISISAS